MKTSNRVLVIGLDGATWDVLDPWIRDGTLPNLARLRQSGSWGALRSSIPPITAAAWTTFMTGKRSGKHGVFHFVRLFEDGASTGGKPEIVNARNIKSPTLWDVLGHYERQVALINVPMTYPPRPVNGFMITGLLTPRHASTFTWPRQLSKELTDYIIDLERFIGVKPFQGAQSSEAIAPTLSLMGEFRDMLEKRARASLDLMTGRPWDLFMVVFTGPDRMGHYLWPYHFPEDGKGSLVRKLHDAIRAYYVRLDEVIGELAQTAGQETFVILMSDHGMGPIYTHRVHWNNWLQGHRWLVVKTSGSRALNPNTWLKRLGLPRDKIGAILLKMPKVSRSGVVKKAAASSMGDVDTNSSKAYCVPIYSHIFGIKLNVGDEERGALRQEIVRALGAVNDPQTGQPIVQEVLAGEEYYQGPYARDVPEIIVIMNPMYTAGFRISHYSSIVTELQKHTDHGDHRMDGIFAVSGPGVLPWPEALPGLSIEDIAPTALYLMGLPVPSDMDGRVLTEVLKPKLLEARPVEMGELKDFWPSRDEAVFTDEQISAEDDAELRERLQALGYLE